MTNPAAAVQPEPKPNDGRAVWELVLEDFQTRDRLGRAKYGVPLQAGNGRDALLDLYQELLDAVVYTRQAIEERSRAKDRLQDALAEMSANGCGLTAHQASTVKGAIWG